MGRKHGGARGREEIYPVALYPSPTPPPPSRLPSLFNKQQLEINTRAKLYCIEDSFGRVAIIALHFRGKNKDEGGAGGCRALLRRSDGTSLGVRKTKTTVLRTPSVVERPACFSDLTRAIGSLVKVV